MRMAALICLSHVYNERKSLPNVFSSAFCIPTVVNPQTIIAMYPRHVPWRFTSVLPASFLLQIAINSFFSLGDSY